MNIKMVTLRCILDGFASAFRRSHVQGAYLSFNDFPGKPSKYLALQYLHQ